MAFVLLVSADSRHGLVLRETLTARGWWVSLVTDREGALRAAADRQPQVVVVDGRVAGAESLVKIFTSRRGGPGAVALGFAADAGAGSAAIGAEADEVLDLQPGADDLIRAVQRVAAIPHRSSAPASPTDDRRLTAAELFGDILSEVAGGAAVSEPQVVRSGVDGHWEETSGSVVVEPVSIDISATSAPDETPGDPAVDVTPGESGDHREAPEDEVPASDASDRVVARDAPELGHLAEIGASREAADDSAHEPAMAGPAPASPVDVTALADEPVASPLDDLPDDAAFEVLPEPEADADAPLPGLGGPWRDEFGDSVPAGSTLDDLAVESLFEVVPDTHDEAEARPLSLIEPETDEAAAWVADGAALFDELPELPEPDLPIPEAEAVGEHDDARVDPGAAGPDLPLLDGARGHVVDDEWPPPAATARPVGSVDADFGQYRLRKRIAVGGMAEVWRASMVGLEGFEKTVAIKKILPHLAENDEFVAMFIDEAKLAARLNHENLVDIYDLGKIEDDFFIAMEYVDGWDLRSILNRLGKRGETFPLGLAFFIAGKVASALDYAHGRCDDDGRPFDLVHRDVSPRNILLGKAGSIKLCDFGVAKAVSSVSRTEIGALKGKIQYMSPEQAQGQRVDGRSDLFSLGSVLFEMVTGRKVFEEDSDISLLEAVRECEIDWPRSIRPDIPPELERIIVRALSKRPESRYQSAGEMLADLEQALFGMKPKPTRGDVAAWLDEIFAEPEESEIGAADREAFPVRVPAERTGEEIAAPVPLGRDSGVTPDRRALSSWLSDSRIRFLVGVVAGLLLAALIALGVNAWLARGGERGIVEPTPTERSGSTEPGAAGSGSGGSPVSQASGR